MLTKPIGRLLKSLERVKEVLTLFVVVPRNPLLFFGVPFGLPFPLFGVEALLLAILI